MTMKTLTLGFLGAGNMAGALIKGLLHAQVTPPDKIVASDVKSDRLKQLAKEHGIRTTLDNHALTKEADVLVLAVKPQVVDKVLAQIGGDVQGPKLVISVAAGVPIAALEARLPSGVKVVRAMPNTPATALAGATAIAAGEHAKDEDLEVARALFEAVGRVVVLDEVLLDAVTARAPQGHGHESRRHGDRGPPHARVGSLAQDAHRRRGSRDAKERRARRRDGREAQTRVSACPSHSRRIKGSSHRSGASGRSASA
jgi:hypothetical protein